MGYTSHYNCKDEIGGMNSIAGGINKTHNRRSGHYTGKNNNKFVYAGQC